MAHKPDKFDPYREALVVERMTEWPDELADVRGEERRRIEERLHDDASAVTHLVYVRLHTGFCRKIVVTAEDVARVADEPSTP